MSSANKMTYIFAALKYMNDIKDFRFDFKYNKNEYFKTHFKCRARIIVFKRSS